MKPEAANSSAEPAGNSGEQSIEPPRLFDEACARVGRLEAVLAATGGTLHDVNNLLTVLSGNLYLLTEAVRENPALLARCRTARNTAQRAGELIRELLSYAREREETVGVICPTRHVRSMQPLLRRSIDPAHKFTINCDKEMWCVAASAAQLESAIANLVINAHEAMSSAGAIKVRVSNKRRRAGDARSIDGRAMEYVCISVADNGCGIPAELMQKVTEPLYTSKPPGKGNGMGLFMVQAFAKKAGGYLKIDSEPGEGTVVSISLPRQPRTSDATANLTVPISTLPAGDETVLLVTSDAAARATITQLLDALGYTVLQSGDREDALRLAREQERIALVICERSVKAEATENDWLSQVRDLAPDVRQVALLDPGADAAAVAPDAHACIQHPIAVPDLARSIRSALESSR